MHGVMLNFKKGSQKQNFGDHTLLRACHLESCKITRKSLLAIALNTKFVKGKSIFLSVQVCS